MNQQLPAVVFCQAHDYVPSFRASSVNLGRQLGSSRCGDAFPIEGVLVATYLLSVEALPHCRCGVANKSFMV